MIGEGEILKITDFGISKKTESTYKFVKNEFAGTLCYSAPEVVEGFYYEFWKSKIFNINNNK